MRSKRVQDCRSERELVDLLVASSCAPPFTPAESIDGVPCLDGGLVDDVPIGTVADVPGQTLVLTTRRYKSFAPVFARDGLRLRAAQREGSLPPVGTTPRPRAYQKTYDLGRRDGEQFLKTFALGQYHEAVSAAAVSAAEADVGRSWRSGPSQRGCSQREPRPTRPTQRDAAGAFADMRATDDIATAEDADVGPMNSVDPIDPRVTTEPVDPIPAAIKARSAGRDTTVRARATTRGDGVLDVSAKLAAYREPTEAGMAEDLSASQPAASDGHERSGRSLRASNI